MAEVEARMPVDELALWYADYDSDPWGQERDDVSRALCATAVCGHMAKSELRVKDLLPRYGTPRELTPEQKRIQAEAKRIQREAWAKGINGR